MIEKFKIDKNKFISIKKNIERNGIIIEYYKRMLNEFYGGDNVTIYNKIKNIEVCNKYFEVNKYEEIKLKDFLKTNLCHDKFCSNCRKIKQAKRMTKYISQLKSYEDNLYHVVLTIKNSSSDKLREDIENMSRAFRKMYIYLSGRKNSSYNICLQGAIRSLEVTFNNNDNTYHAHYHCIFYTDIDLNTEKKYINKFSYSNNKLIRKFNNYEIMLQNLWYRLINNISLRNINIEDNQEDIYSCIIDNIVDSSYYEVFKYMFKENTDFNYDNFNVLYQALYRVKQIQGYGVFYKVSDDDTDIVNIEYEKFISELNKLYDFKNTCETIEDVISDDEYIHISKNQYYKYLRDSN